MRKVFLGLITFYKKYLSYSMPPACRFHPTCSEYAYTSVERYGFFKGVTMAFSRILRCNPFNSGGYDPVK